jgi:hypothetical protein
MRVGHHAPKAVRRMYHRHATRADKGSNRGHNLSYYN